jgi:hypothetical protein
LRLTKLYFVDRAMLPSSRCLPKGSWQFERKTT